jgi:hypothetical protein
MSAQDRFVYTLREFVDLVGGDPASLDDGAELEFEFDGMLAFIFQHPQDDAVVIDIEVLQLRQPQTEPVNLERFLLLHQLNGLTRFTHGAQAQVSVDHMLMVTRSLPLSQMTGQKLAETLDQMFDVAADLRAMWTDLQALLGRTAKTLQGIDATAAAPLVPGQFA